ncbi:MAG: hypothetical protein JW782_08115 [Candidatus Saganbacteria bacterium]|nr:hypothetical protein [Candidatus Saganbacteria bacterium]
MQANPLVVLTGINQEFTANRNNGKTYACTELFKFLLGRGVRVEYRDMKQELKLANRASAYIDLDRFQQRTVAELPSAAYYLLDEFHQAFPRHPEVTARDHWGIPVYRGERYNSVMFEFWGKLNDLMKQGSFFLLATALHPQRAEYQQFLHDTEIPMMAAYFRAPVMELPPTGL